jgi:hypothetical protein
MAEVVQHGLADLRRQGIGGGVAPLASAGVQYAGSPVEVVQGQRGDLSRAETIDDKQHEHRVVAPTNDRTTLDRGQRALDVRCADRARDLREAVGPRAVDSNAEIVAHGPFPEQVSQERAESGARRTERAGADVNATLREEPVEDCGRERLGREASRQDVLLESLELEGVRGDGRRAEPTLPPQVLEESRCPALERTCHARLRQEVAALDHAEELLDRPANVAKELPLGDLRAAGPGASAKMGPYEGVEVTVQLLDAGGSTLARPLAEPQEEWYATKHAP